MADVVTLSVKPRGYSAQAVELLEQLLADAKAGELLSITYVAEIPGNQIVYGWTGCDDIVLVCGHVARLQHRLQQRLDAQSSECPP